ncbi:hypothetical protein GCM10009836_11920 [Pseudonocardia ailaonensis]|uniref:Zinc-finger domain-containing protein n=1 Tax=Pseudonocardia ailaonensis TaxID=367279 RepID=A0ABN2MQJ2_9PSEU
MTDCEGCRELAPELALGLVTGSERAAAHAHLQQCAECREHVAELAGIHDRLRDLIPPAEPPVGFEQRVLNRIGTPRAPAPRGSWWGRLAIAAAAVAVVFGGGWAAGSATSGRPVPAAVAAPLVAGDRHVGDVVVARDRPAFVSLYLDVPSAGRLSCTFLRKDGSVAGETWYDADRGTSWWGVALPAGGATVRIADSAGAVVGAGSIPSP